MKIKNLELINSVGVISKILNQELTIKVQFNLDKNVKEINKVLESYNNTKKKLIEKYCDKGEDNKPLIVDNQYTFETNNEAFNKEFKELNDIENDIKLIKFDIEELTPVKVNNAELQAIKYLIK